MFEPYRFLWSEDFKESFRNFLHGSVMQDPRPISGAEAMRSRASVHSAKSSHPRLVNN